MKPDQQCKKCGQGAYHNKGFSKTKFTPEYPNGVPYENIKCADPKCGHIVWIDVKGSPQPQNSPKDGFAVIGDTLHRIEEKLNILLGDKGIKTEWKASDIPVIEDDRKEDEWQRIGAIERDEIQPKDIPF